MSNEPMFPGLFVSLGMPSKETMAAMDKAMQEWTLRAARGECAWICADCCVTFSEGMPDSCMHGHQSCSDIIQRDKQDAQQRQGEGGDHGNG